MCSIRACMFILILNFALLIVNQKISDLLYCLSGLCGDPAGRAALLASNGFFNKSVLDELNLFNVETVCNRVAGESN